MLERVIIPPKGVAYFVVLTCLFTQSPKGAVGGGGGQEIFDGVTGNALKFILICSLDHIPYNGYPNIES